MGEWGMGQSFWLWLLPVPIVWHLYRVRVKAPWPALLPTLSIRFPLPAALNASSESTAHSSHSPVKERLLLLALILFIVALAQPLKYIGDAIPSESTQPVDLALLVDTNITMVIEDYQVEGENISRMKLTRQLLSDFIENYSGSRIGLSLMGDPPLHWLPYTTDRSAVLDAVSRLRPALGGRLSDMPASLQLIADKYLSTDVAAAQEKVVVMLTDSSLQLGAISPQQAAANLAATGAHLYVIAIGSTDQTPELIAEQTGDFVYEPVDLKLLSQVAQAGAGELFHAADSGTFKQALQRIEAAHRQPIDVQPSLRLSQPLYPIPLLLGALLLLLALLGGKSNSNSMRSSDR